jgi:hypothetical protein
MGLHGLLQDSFTFNFSQKKKKEGGGDFFAEQH